MVYLNIKIFSLFYFYLFLSLFFISGHNYISYDTKYLVMDLQCVVQHKIYFSKEKYILVAPCTRSYHIYNKIDN